MNGSEIADDGAAAMEKVADGAGRVGEESGELDGDGESEEADGDLPADGSENIDSDEVESAADGSATGGQTTAPLSSDLIEGVERQLPTVASLDLTVPEGASSPERITSVLVAVGGGPHSGAAVDAARELAAERDAWLELFHVVSRDDAESTVDVGEAYLSAATERLGDFDDADDWLVEDGPAADAVVEQSEYYDVVVVGTPTTGRVSRFVFGSTAERVTEEADAPVVVVEADGSTELLDE